MTLAAESSASLIGNSPAPLSQMPKKLEKQKALITGASQGIGRAISLAFAREGADVALTARNRKKLDSVAAECQSYNVKTLVIPADLSVPDDIETMTKTTLDNFGEVSILVNNAAVIHPTINIEDFELELWEHVFNVNITGAFLVTRAILPWMKSVKNGKIINISSLGGRKGAAGRSAYRVTKAGMISFTESLAAEVKKDGIYVNAICPGSVDTEGFREVFNTLGRQENPSLMVPEEIAHVAVFLASAESSGISGTAIDVFGESNPIFS